MTSRERVYAAMEHRTPDRTPIFEYVLQPPVADAVLGREYACGSRLEAFIKEEGWEQALRRQAADVAAIAGILGHDLVYVCPNPLPPAVRAERRERREETVHADPVEEVEGRVEQAERSLAPPEDESFLIYGLVREELERSGLDLPLFAPAYLHGVWTDTALMQTMLLAPEVARRHFRLATRRALMRVEKYRALDIEIIGVGGDFAGNRGPVISPGSYREFIVPEVRRVSENIHSCGGRAVNASDGNLWPVIDDFLYGCGADGYIEIDLRAGMDLGELKRRFGASVTFFGNIDCAGLLSFSSPERVREHTVQCLRKGLGGGGHILCCNNAITASVPAENYTAIYEAYREFFAI